MSTSKDMNTATVAKIVKVSTSKSKLLDPKIAFNMTAKQHREYIDKNDNIDEKRYKRFNNLLELDDFDDVLKELTFDLENVDLDKVREIFNDNPENDFLDTVRIVSGESIVSTDYDRLAGRLFTYFVHLTSTKTMKDYLEIVGPKVVTVKVGIKKVTKTKKIFGKHYYNFYKKNSRRIQNIWDSTRYLDYVDCDYFSATTFYTKYSLKLSLTQSFETRQQTLFRTAVQAFCHRKNAMEKISTYFQLLARGCIIHASSTNFNACLCRKYRQLASCFLVDIQDDSEHIALCGYVCNQIGKHTGGIGIRISRMREKDQDVGGRGKTIGVIPQAKKQEEDGKYWRQGCIRKGARTLQNEVTHCEIVPFIKLKTRKYTLKEVDTVTPDLHTCVIFNWMFMYFLRQYMEGDAGVRAKLAIPSFSPKIAQELYGLKGEELYDTYFKYIEDETVPRVHILVHEILSNFNKIDKETGHPFAINTCEANFKSNQNVIVTLPTGKKYEFRIMMSNLCLEIYETVDAFNIAVCNLGQASVRKFAKQVSVGSKRSLIKRFNFEYFGYCMRWLIHGMHGIISKNVSPNDHSYKHEPSDKYDHPRKMSTRSDIRIGKSNIEWAPLAAGVSGYADALHIMDVLQYGEDGFAMARMIFGCMYYNSLLGSVENAIEQGHSHKYFEDTKMYKGKFQFDLWKDSRDVMLKLKLMSQEEVDKYRPLKYCTAPDPASWGQPVVRLSGGHKVNPTWRSEGLHGAIVKHGLANSLVNGAMPSATTSQALGNTQSIEPIRAIISSRRTDYGTFTKYSKALEKDLRSLNLYTPDFFKAIMINNSSLKEIHNLVYASKGIPIEGVVKDIFRSDSGSRTRVDIVPDFVASKKNLLKLGRIQAKYATAYETDPMVRNEMQSCVGPMFDQGISYNYFLHLINDDILNKLRWDGFLRGLKTIKYYTRSTSAFQCSLAVGFDNWLVETVKSICGREEFVDMWKLNREKEIAKAKENNVKKTLTNVEIVEDLSADIEESGIPADVLPGDIIDAMSKKLTHPKAVNLNIQSLIDTEAGKKFMEDEEAALTEPVDAGACTMVEGCISCG